VGSKKGRTKRLAQLEEILGGPLCPECLARDIYTGGESTYTLYFDDDLIEAGEDAPEESVYCGTCGELVFVVLKFDEHRF
jgi:hypothetical protein